MRLLSASVYGLWVKYTLAVVTGILVCIRSINAAILHQTPSHFMVRHQFNKMTHLSMGKVDSTDMDVKLGRYVTKAALDLQALILASKETKDKRKESKGDDKMSMSITNGSRTSGHHYVLENAYIVELNADAGTQAAVREQEAFKNTLDKLGIVWKPRYTFNTIMNGMSITIPNAYVDTILAMSMVKQAWPIVATNRPRHFTETVMGKKSSLQDAHDFTGVNLLHEEGYSGRGVRVAIIDSGIDYRHPALGNCYGRNDPTAKCLIAFGYDFVGDEYDGVTYLAKEDDDPMDTCNGHGTHVAGIIGADSKVLRGVAPNVTFGIYRVFGCTGYGEDDVILAAMERAVQDGMEVINMSMGSGSAWAASPLSLAAARLVERGIVVVAASGNDGDKGLWQISAPGIGKNVISVASMDSFEYYTYGIRTDTGEDIDYWRGHLERINLGKTKLVLARNLSLNHLSRKDSDINSNPNMTDNTGCSALGSHVKNNVVLVERGGCSFTEKVKNAYKAGARAILIYNNELGLVDPTSDDNSIPYASLSQTNGHKLVRLIESRLGNAARSGWNKRNKKKDDEKTDRGRDAYPYVEIEFLKEARQYPNPTGGAVSTFSSWGLGPNLELKPDIGAPGSLVLSTYPLNLGEYATLSGTSMAAPYIAGAAALMLEHYKRHHNGAAMHPKELLDRLRLTSRPTANQNNLSINTEDWEPTNAFFRALHSIPGNDSMHSLDDMTRKWKQIMNVLEYWKNYFVRKIRAYKPRLPVVKQGAGLVHVYDAVKLNFSASPAYLELNATTTDDVIQRVIRIENNSPEDVIIHMQHHASLAVNGYKDGFDLLPEPVTVVHNARVEFSETYIWLNRQAHKNVTVTFRRPAGLPANELWIYSGFVTVKIRKIGWSLTQIGTLSIPYAGVAGDYRSLPVLTPPGYGLPMIRAADTGTSWTSADKMTRAFTFYDHDYPRIGIRLEHPTAKLHIHATDVDGTLIGTIPSGTKQLLGRNDHTPNNMITYLHWNGQVLPITKGNFSDQMLTKISAEAIHPTHLSDGYYRIHIAALRPFGDPYKATDYDTWLSPIIPINATASLK